MSPRERSQQMIGRIDSCQATKDNPWPEFEAAIVEAILEEREACAKIVETCHDIDTPEDLAARIRARSQP